MVATLVPLLAALTSSIEVPASAQEPAALEVETIDPNAYGVQASQLLLSFSGSYTYDNQRDAEVESLRLEASLGWFATQAHEFGARLDYLYDTTAFDEGGGTTNDALRFGPYYNWNTELSPRLDAYVGPHAELFSFDPSGDGRSNDFGIGVQVGARYWLRPGIAIQLEPRWTLREHSENEFQTLFGLSFAL